MVRNKQKVITQANATEHRILTLASPENQQIHTIPGLMSLYPHTNVTVPMKDDGIDTQAQAKVKAMAGPSKAHIKKNPLKFVLHLVPNLP